MPNFIIEDIVKEIVELDGDSMSKAQVTLDNLTKPQGSLGRLEELAKQISGKLPAALIQTCQTSL